MKVMKLSYKLVSGVIIAGLMYVLYTKHKQHKSYKHTSNKKDSSTQTEIPKVCEEDSQTEFLKVQDSDVQTTFLNTITEETGSQMNLAELNLLSPDTTNSDYSTNSPTTEDLINEVQQLNTGDIISQVDYSDIEEMTVLELKEYCKHNGIKGTSRMKKSEIIDYIKKLE